MIEAGKLDRRIKVQRATVSRNEMGEEVAAWADVAEIWAGVTPVSDGEKFRAAQVGAEITSRFIVRHSSLTASISAEDRILYQGRVYDIQGSKEIGRREGYEITAGAQADVAAG
jgi:SPP1 family predicted phage head-tail adaptor